MTAHHREGSLARVGLALAAWSERWFPEPLVIALLGVVPDVLVAHPSVLAKNVPGLVALAKANPESLTFGTSGAGTANLYSTYRVIPTDGRAHRKGDDYDLNPYGDPVGHWEGNTLVIDTTGFDDSTWFGQDGYFHTDAMRVIERFTRKGGTLEYSATVEDPNVLTKPFNLNPTPLTLKKGDAVEFEMRGEPEVFHFSAGVFQALPVI